MANKVVKTIPKNEKKVVKLFNEDEKLTHIITEKQITLDEKEFILYKVEDDDVYSLLGRSNNPNKLEEKYIFRKKED